MGGGTGSGCFLDICYLIKYILEHQALSGVASVKGYLFLPDVNLSRFPFIPKQNEVIETNAYGFIKELDYCMNFEYNGGEWNQDYDNVSVVSKAAPVDRAFLIGAKTESGAAHSNPYDYAMNVVTNYVLFDSLIRKTGVNLNELLSQEKAEFIAFNALNNAPRNSTCRYSALGGSRVYIPYKEIITYIASKIIEVYNVQPSLNHDIDMFIKDNNLTYEDLLKKLQKNVPDVPVLEPDYHVLFEQVQGISPNTIPCVLAEMRDSIEEIEGKIHENKKSSIENLLNELKGKLIEISISEDKGPKYASLFIRNYIGSEKDILSALDGYLKENEIKLCHGYADLELIKNEIAVTLEELQNSRVISRKRKTQNYNFALHRYYSVLAKIALYREMDEFLHIFKEEIQHIHNDFLEPLLTILKNFRETAKENVWYISQDVMSDDYGYKVIGNVELKDLCDAYLQECDIPRVYRLFNEHIFKKSFNSTNEREVVKSISNFFTDLFSDALNKSVEDFLSQKFNTDSPIVISNEVYNIIQTLNNSTELLISIDDENNAEISIEVCNIPGQSDIIGHAAQMFNHDNNTVLIEMKDCTDSIAITKTKYNIPIASLSNIKHYKMTYEQCNMMGVHLYEGDGDDGKDFRKLPEIC